MAYEDLSGAELVAAGTSRRQVVDPLARCSNGRAGHAALDGYRRAMAAVLVSVCLRRVRSQACGTAQRRRRSLPTGFMGGSPEDALDTACGLYLADPTAWT
jgi:hypothetical protein